MDTNMSDIWGQTISGKKLSGLQRRNGAMELASEEAESI